MINANGIKLNVNYIIIGIVVLLLLVGLGWFFYKKGKNKTTLQYDPYQLPGEITGDHQVGASNDELKSLSSELFNDMSGFNFFSGWNVNIYNRALLLNDKDLIKLYNAFNAVYQKEYDSTLTKMISDEQNKLSQMNLLELRLKKLNCL